MISDFRYIELFYNKHILFLFYFFIFCILFLEAEKYPETTLNDGMNESLDQK